jgi:hypothetical protein
VRINTKQEPGISVANLRRVGKGLLAITLVPIRNR